MNAHDLWHTQDANALRTLAKHASSCSLYWVQPTPTPEDQAHETDLAGNENAQTDHTASATCANTIGRSKHSATIYCAHSHAQTQWLLRL